MENARIMIVEDEKIVARDIKNRLKKLGYNVQDIVSSGEDAILKAEETKPDLVLMDIVLKGDIDGIQAAKKIRDRFNIPVIYLTAYSDDGAIERAKLTEPSGYIIKPFQTRELRSSIEIALYNHEMEKKLRKENHWLSRTLKTIGDCVIITDNYGSVTFVNPAAEALTGWSREEIVGKHLADMFKVKNHETDTKSLLEKVLHQGVFFNLTRIT
ncbi:MAG: response regulator, partial [Thermodesulfobacteriota bacterium]